MKYADLQLRQLSSTLEKSRSNALRPPRDGWLKTIRTTLGMSMEQAAKRSGITAATWNAAEKRERAGSISIENLQKSADALGCDLIYTLIPRTPLVEMVRIQAKKRTSEDIDAIATTMRIEDQTPSRDHLKRLRQSIFQKYITGKMKNLW